MLSTTNELLDSWQIGPFTKRHEVNPVLGPLADTVFDCPLAGPVRWEQKDVFNPAAATHEGAIHLLYRAEDAVGLLLGTSRVGLAVSQDGLTFERRSEPVLYPDKDHMEAWEWPGGCEDPRVVRDEGGTFYLTYTTFPGDKARLAVATSTDLRTWTKRGLAFAGDPEYGDVWSKAGSIVCRREGDQMIATRVNGVYWMYWGESHVFAATSEDLVYWTPLRDTVSEDRTVRLEDGQWRGIAAPQVPSLRRILSPRTNAFDSGLVEPGPPAVLTDEGIVLIYNASNLSDAGDTSLPPGTYAPGQALFSRDDPASLIGRCRKPFLVPMESYETTGQFGNTCFVEGLAPMGDHWYLYYGTADSRIAVATAPLEKDRASS